MLPVLNGEAVRMAVKFGLAVGAERRAALGVRAQELLLSGPAEGLPDQPVRAAGGRARATWTSCSTTARRSASASRARTSKRTPASRCTKDLPKQSGIDLNRAGTPLIEIVSEPDMRSAKEAVAYLKKVHTLVRYLEICDGNMQEGSFRCDANVSVRKVGAEKFGTRAEIKNLNSFRFVEKAINYEVARQIEVIEGGGKVVQETRLYDPDKGETRTHALARKRRTTIATSRIRTCCRVVIDAAYIASVQRDAARAAGPEGRALRGAVRPVGVRRRRADVVEGAGGVLRRGRQTTGGGKEPSKEQAKLAANWVVGSLAAALNEHNLEIGESRIGAAGARGPARRASPTTPSPARSPRTCSKPCGRKAKTPTRSSSRRA